MKKRIQIVVRGNNVQRCGFRRAAVEMATNLNLTGIAMYVDHDVQIEIEGNTGTIEEFAAWASIGPAECNISSFEEQEIPVIGDSTFETIPGVVSSKKSA